MNGQLTGPIVVGVDGSDAALHAVRWAAREAVQRNRPLRLVHATDEFSLNYPRGPATSEDLLDVVRMRGRRLLRRARETVREVGPGLEPTLKLGHESAAVTLLDEAATAGLLVLATPGSRRLSRLLIGSATVAVATHARCPVALIRPHVAEDAPPDGGPVVVGVDGSPAGEEAVAVAFDEASWRRAPLIAVHCWDEPFFTAVFEGTRWAPDKATIDAREAEVLAERLAGWQEKYPDVAVERVVTHGKPAASLLDYADRAQLLVVGSRGRGGVTGLVLGSTSQALMSYALCPVLIARHPGAKGAD